MAFHIIQAQHGSPVTVVAAFVFLLHASAHFVLDHLIIHITIITDLRDQYSQSVKGAWKTSLQFSVAQVHIV